MRVFIVHAHPEPKSFNGAMTREAAQALMAAGHDVTISDLYAMAFNPVSDRRNFVTVKDADYYRQQNEEAYATTHDGFAQDIQAEMDNTRVNLYRNSMSALRPLSTDRDQIADVSALRFRFRAGGSNVGSWRPCA